MLISYVRSPFTVKGNAAKRQIFDNVDQNEVKHRLAADGDYVSTGDEEESGKINVTELRLHY